MMNSRRLPPPPPLPIVSQGPARDFIEVELEALGARVNKLESLRARKKHLLARQADVAHELKNLDITHSTREKSIFDRHAALEVELRDLRIWKAQTKERLLDQQVALREELRNIEAENDNDYLPGGKQVIVSSGDHARQQPRTISGEGSAQQPIILTSAAVKRPAEGGSSVMDKKHKSSSAVLNASQTFSKASVSKITVIKPPAGNGPATTAKSATGMRGVKRESPGPSICTARRA